MAVNQGAIQLQIIINNKSLSISKKHLVSLSVKRVIGDSANDFTLEVFDETAYQVENLLIGSAFPSITVKYSSSTSLTKSVIFTGMCLDYSTTFTGRAMMLSITGILMTTGDVYDGWWFDKSTIEWCGSEISDYGELGKTHEYWIDGKNSATFSQYKDNRDVCAIVVSDENGGATAYFNPGRIFQRIIHKYNGDKLGTGTISKTYTGSYDAGSIDDIKKYVWDSLIGAGYSNIATAAVMGNIEWESGFDTDKIEVGNGIGFGLCQWSYGRRTALENYAASMNKNPGDLGIQMTFLLAELTPGGGAGGYASYQLGGQSSSRYDGNSYTADDWEDSNDVNKATVAFMALFERPSYDPSVNHLSKRKESSNYYYESLKNKSASDEIVTGQIYTLKEDAEMHTMPTISSSVKGTLSAGTEIEVIAPMGNWVHVQKTSDTTVKGYITKWKTAGEPTPTGVRRGYDDTTLEVEGWGTGGTGKYVIAECDETRWIANLDTIQNNETAAQYITRVLCKASVSDTGKSYEDETAGFKYWCDAKGHHFKALDYNEKITPKINVSYGLRNSQIISFSISNLGAVAMIWGDKTKRNSVTASAASMSDLYNDSITAGGENLLLAPEERQSDSVLNAKKAILNWYQDTLPAVQVKTSMSESELSATLSNLYDELSEYAISAELTLWGEHSKGYSPGDYIDIIVMTAAGHKHYSSGIYIITSMEDNISGAGYTQTLRLLKINKTANGLNNSQSLSSPELSEDGSGNIIATYTPVRTQEEIEQEKRKEEELAKVQQEERKKQLDDFLIEAYEQNYSTEKINEWLKAHGY